MSSIHKILDEIKRESGLTKNEVMYIFEQALEAAVCSYFGVRECLIDLEGKKIFPVYGIESVYSHSEKHLKWINFSELDPWITRDCRDNFTWFLRRAKEDELLKKWRNRVHQTVQGEIECIRKSEINVRLEDDVHATMLKSEWVPREVPLYRQGDLLWFYVLKVARVGDGVRVYLSRGSINFPVALLRSRVPWVKFKPVRRIRGSKSWVEASEEISSVILREVSRDLMGEVVEVMVAR